MEMKVVIHYPENSKVFDPIPLSKFIETKDILLGRIDRIYDTPCRFVLLNSDTPGEMHFVVEPYNPAARDGGYHHYDLDRFRN